MSNLSHEQNLVKWEGIIQRNPSYYSTINDLLLNNVPRSIWFDLSKINTTVKEALTDYINNKIILSDNCFREKGELFKFVRYFEDNIKRDFITYFSFKREEETKNFPEKTLTSKIGEAFNKKDVIGRILEFQPCYYDGGKNWWLWNWQEKRWERVDETEILIAMDKQATLNTINSKEKNELLEALKQVSRGKRPIEIKDTWIQFRDEIVDIETGERFKATPEYFVTNPIPWSLHKDNFYETPAMDRIFEEWVGKENVQKLYEILAYCLLPDYPIHRIFCFIGAGMNGKSKFLELLRRFIGGKNCCSTELDTLLMSRFEVTRLHKKLVCQMGETNFGELSKTSILKKLSGGDLIGFEYKNKDPIEDKNYAKILIATNNLPSTTDKTIGFYRRWMIIDFPNQFTEAKDILGEIPKEEYECLALKCTFILRELLKNRKFTNEGSIEDRMNMYESKSNFLMKFIDEFCVVGDNKYTTKASFGKKFKAWCKERGHREMSDNSIGRQMKEMGYESEKKYFNWMYDGKGGQVRCWMGLGFKDE